MTISQRIFALLREKHLSQKELSIYADISQAAISSWKTKGTNPSSDKIVAICQFLDVDPYYLLTGESSSSMLHLEDTAVAYQQSQDANELLLLEMFRQLSPLEQGRILGNTEQMLVNYQSQRSQK